MTEDRTKLPCLKEKKPDGRCFFTYRSKLDKFKQKTKWKYEIDVGPLIKEETITGTGRKTKEDTIQQDFLWALGPKSLHQITSSENRTDLEFIKKVKTNQN